MERRRPQSAENETDAINAELQAARADWSWEAIVQEADEVNEQLIGEISAAGPDLPEQWDQLIGGTFGNGPFHALEHFNWLDEAAVGLDSARVAAFVEELGKAVTRGTLPDRDAGTALYNIACYHSLAGRLDEARPLLRDAFRLRPDLAEFALEDTDLTAASRRDRLAGCAGGRLAGEQLPQAAVGRCGRATPSLEPVWVADGRRGGPLFQPLDRLPARVEGGHVRA